MRTSLHPPFGACLLKCLPASLFVMAIAFALWCFGADDSSSFFFKYALAWYAGSVCWSYGRPRLARAGGALSTATGRSVTYTASACEGAGAHSCVSSSSNSMFDNAISSSASNTFQPAVNIDGTPMCGSVDIHGNPYGVTSPSWNDHSASASSSWDHHNTASTWSHHDSSSSWNSHGSFDSSNSFNSCGSSSFNSGC